MAAWFEFSLSPWFAAACCCSSPRAWWRCRRTGVPSQFVHDRWTKEDGLPLDMVADVTQTPDGYLWLATQQGVARFDGREFRCSTP